MYDLLPHNSLETVALVAGASGGLGGEIAKELSKVGFHVALHCQNNPAAAETLAGTIEHGRVFIADVSSAESVKRMIEGVEQWKGRLDLIVNSAGVTHEALIVKTTVADFDNVINTNLKGAFNLIKFGAALMKKGSGGQIINISSYTAFKGSSGLAAYAASKAALSGLSLSAARELAGDCIRVNVVLPGFMLTRMGLESSVQARKTAVSENLLCRYGNPHSVARFIAQLAENKDITGQVFNLDGRPL